MNAYATLKVKAIIPVILYRQPADFSAINEIAQRHGIPVIEDAAQSFGAKQFGHHSCALSTIGTTSFSPSKPLGAYGDGGACFTNNLELANRIRRISRHGPSSNRNRHSDCVTNRAAQQEATVQDSCT